MAKESLEILMPMSLSVCFIGPYQAVLVRACLAICFWSAGRATCLAKVVKDDAAPPTPIMPPREEAHLAECLVIDLVEVAQEVLPAIDVGELLHDPEGVDVVLGDIDGDGCEHREASRQPGRERDRGGLTGFEGDGGGRKAVVPGKGEAGLDRGGLLRQGNGVVVGAELAQFLPQVVG